MESGFSISRFIRLITALSFAILQLTACQSNISTVAESEIAPLPSFTLLAQLTPYKTPTPSQSPLPPAAATYTPFPTPTATPRSHVIQQGEDMFGIAYQYGLTLQELQTANPDVDPNFLSVGSALLIPASTQINDETNALPSPTPAGALIGETKCYRTGEGGLWCFTPVTNQSEKYIESVSLQIRLGKDGVQVATASAVTAVSLIPPGVTIPATAYFAPTVPEQVQVNAVLETSLIVKNMKKRYVTCRIENLVQQISTDGKNASVSGDVILDESVPSHITVAAIAYDDEGNVVGFRKWEQENTSENTPTSIHFSMQVYSLAGKIDMVTIFTEALR